MAVTHLPLPAVVGFPTICPRCAYDLAGSAGRDRCPECGLGIVPGTPCLAIACVPRRAAGPKWRRVVWVLITVVLFLTTQGWLFIIAISPWLLLSSLVGCIAGSIAMVKTGTAGKRSTERVIFATSGLMRSPWESREAQEFHAWDGRYSAKGKQIGAVWQRIEIFRAAASDDDDPKPKKPTLLISAGLRCERESLDFLVACIDAYARGEVPDPELLVVFEDFTPGGDEFGPENEPDGDAEHQPTPA